MASKSNPAHPPKTTPRFYTAKLERLNPRMQTLLEAHGIAPDDTLQHVQDVRDRAWSVSRYPCIGDFLFTDFEMPNHACFDKMLDRLREGQRLLDLGCGFGQELRNLAALGIDPAQLFGLDNTIEMIEFGYDLFRDKDGASARFVIGDMLDVASFPADLLGKIDIVFAGCSFHLFDWDHQIQAVSNAVALLKEQPGSMIFGWQLGRTQSKAVRGSGASDLYVHDVSSFKRLWMKVGEKTGKKFTVVAGLKSIPEGSHMLEVDPDFRVLRFEVKLAMDGQASSL